VTRFDIAIVGAGMAGAALAAEIGARARILILEAEAAPGMHATGRSAAFWSETYGGPLIEPLTSASRPALEAGDFLKARGAIHIAQDAAGRAALDALAAGFAGAGFAGSAIILEPLDRAALADRIPGLLPEWTSGLWEPGCADINVAAFHADCLARARRAGAIMCTGARLERATRGGGYWRLDTPAGPFEAAILVDAAGAWADDVAARAGAAPLGIAPHRRTMVELALEPALPPDLPLVVDALGGFYFKPEGDGRLWLSPQDEHVSPPCDCAPEELDVATAIARFETVIAPKRMRVAHRWAGLRSFAPDRLPAIGFAEPGFFWCAGQGGFGIQTAPALSRLCATLLLGEAPERDPAPYLAGRFAA